MLLKIGAIPKMSYALSSENFGNRNGILSRSISSLKWLLALSILIDHFFRAEEVLINETVYRTYYYPAYVTISNIVVAFVRGYAVPVFFFISGFLSYKKDAYDTKGWIGVVNHRFVRLLIPYLVFSIYAYIISCFVEPIYIELVGGMDNGIIRNEGCSGILNTFKFVFGLNDYYPSINVPLWYMRDLMCIILLLPMLHWMLGRTNGWIVWILGVVFVCKYGLFGSRPEVGIFFFMWGYWMRWKNINIGKYFEQFVPILFGVYVVFGTFYYSCHADMPYVARIIKNINIVACIPLSVGFAYMLVRRGYLKGNLFLASASFFLYVTHYNLRSIVKWSMLVTVNPADESVLGTITMFLSFFILACGILVAYWALKKTFPRFVSIICGFR